MRRQVLKLLPRLAAQASAARGPAWQLRGFADDASLKKTTLYDFHVAHGGAPRRSRARAERARAASYHRCMRRIRTAVPCMLVGQPVPA